MKMFIVKSTVAAVIVISIVLLVFSGNITAMIASDKKETIKIGYIGPLTGDASQWGIPPKEGIELAAGMLDKENVEVVYEDDRCDPKEAVSAVQKLIYIDNVDAIIGAVCSSSTLAIAPIAESSKIVLISPASTNPKITNAGDYIFRVVPSDDLRGKIFAKYIKDDLAITSVAILYISNDGGEGNKESFKKSFEKLGGRVVAIESYDQTSRDMRSQLTKIVSKNPEALVVVSYISDSIVIMQQAKELGLSMPLYFQTEALEDPSVTSGAGNATEGVVYILPAEPEGKEKEFFREMFEKRFHREPALYAAEGFDAFNIITKAILECGEKGKECIKESIYNTKDYMGASGTISFDKNGDVIKPMAIKRIENGERKIITIL